MARQPLSYQGDPSRVAEDGPAGPVSVVVPVWGAPRELARCVESLLAHTDLGRDRLLLVLDGPQPEETEALAARLAGEREGVEVLRNPLRQGFVAAVNRGMAASRGDVVLLNSDTRVTAGWLRKLQRAARSAREIATVTPFSNSATICSLPRPLESNALPAGWDADAFGRLVEDSALCAYPHLPTGVGVCLYIKRKALDAIGLFDTSSFGLGYGEECDFCMRALQAGYSHVLDDATFIFHEGHRSFGPSRRHRMGAARRRLHQLHPAYEATIARFLREDPLRPLRERVVARLLPASSLLWRSLAPDPVPHPTGRPAPQDAARPGASQLASSAGATSPTAPSGGRSPRRVVHLVHGWPPWNQAGTELYAAWLARSQAAFREVTVYSRIADPARVRGDALELLDEGARVRLMVNNFDARDPLVRNALRDRVLEADFARLLDETRPEILHVHHLSGHALSLLGAARRRRIPILYQLQDWWAPCARANLLDSHRRLCPGPAAGRCAACLPLTRLPPAALTNRLLYTYRRAVARRALRLADVFVTGSEFVRESYLSLGFLRRTDPVHVLAYGIPLTARAPRRAPPGAGGRPLRFGLIASILPHKGIHTAVEAFAGLDPDRARLLIWGDSSVDPAYTRELAALRGPDGARRGAVELAGRFDEARKAEIFASLDVLLVPSLGLESFGLVAREAFHHGVPVLASRRGALAELLRDGEPPQGARERDARDQGARQRDAMTTGALPRDAQTAGALFDPEQPGALKAGVERLIAEPELITRWAGSLPAVKGATEHAAEIEEIYEQLLAGPGLTPS